MRDWADPNSIKLSEECRIYGDGRASVYAVVDLDDYRWALQWLWRPKFSRNGKKFYLCRTTHEGSRATRVQKTLFLHTAIMQRAGIEPPSPAHVVIDHRDGDGLNCRKSNLRWATYEMNNRNIYGANGHDLDE